MSQSDDLVGVLETIDALQRKLTGLRKSIYRDIRATELPKSHGDLLSCRVGVTTVALPLDRVQTVVHRCTLLPIPEAPSWVAGLLDLQGDMVPVLDLHQRLFGEAHEPSMSDVLIVCVDGDQRAAMLAQAIGDVHFNTRLDGDADLHDIPHGPYVMAVAHVDAAPLVVLSIARLVSALELPEEAVA